MTMNNGYQCFHCGKNTVCWDSDCDFDDLGIVMTDDDDNYTTEGIVHLCHCSNCGAEIEYRIPIFEEEDDDEEVA